MQSPGVCHPLKRAGEIRLNTFPAPCGFLRPFQHRIRHKRGEIAAQPIRGCLLLTDCNVSPVQRLIQIAHVKQPDNTPGENRICIHLATLQIGFHSGNPARQQHIAFILDAIGDGRQTSNVFHIRFQRPDQQVHTFRGFQCLAAFQLLFHRNALAVTLRGGKCHLSALHRFGDFADRHCGFINGRIQLRHFHRVTFIP